MNPFALRLPAHLRAAYERTARHYGAPGTSLDGFAGRWIALRADTACDPGSAALLDESPAAFDHDYRRFRAEAARLAGGAALVWVQMQRRHGGITPPPQARGGAVQPMHAVRIIVDAADHPVAAVGLIELDAAGVAQCIHPPQALEPGARLA